MLVAIGSLPNTEWLAGSGLAVGDGLVGALAVGVTPKAIRPWRQAIANRSVWMEYRRPNERAAELT